MSKTMTKSAIKVMTMLNLNREQAEKVDATLASYAADLAALRTENAKLRRIIADMLAYAQDKNESQLLDSSGRIVIRMPLDTYRAARVA